jgi:uncharacterized protein YukE
MAFKVDYRSFPSAVSSIRSHASDLNSDFKSVFSKIENMHSEWQGDRYASLCTKFNGIVPEVNDILELVVTEIPFTLESIANNYEAADTETTAAVAKSESPDKVNELTIPNKEPLYVEATSIENVRSSVSDCLDEAQNRITSIEGIVDGLLWEGKAADNCKSKLKTLKNSLIKSFEELKVDFESLMKTAVEEFNKAEEANSKI